ncbi:MAG: hypothetical protein OEZ06_11385 [Myxococcales bacterium]|nr:hypothetical protein [Myxococcales bacterium]
MACTASDAIEGPPVGAMSQALEARASSWNWNGASASIWNWSPEASVMLDAWESGTGATRAAYRSGSAVASGHIGSRALVPATGYGWLSASRGSCVQRILTGGGARP